MLNQLVDSNASFLGNSDIQQTSFSLDAIARFVCNTYDEAISAQQQGGFEFDVVIVGSGMYGAYAAKTLFETSIRLPLQRKPRVLILESGPFLISEHVQNLTRMGEFYNLVKRPVVDENQIFLTQINRKDTDALQGFEPHHRCVGGKSLFWGGWAPPLGNEDATDDLARWPAAVRDYLLSPTGYARVAKQIGTAQTADYVKGELLDFFKSRAQSIVANKTVSGLVGVKDAPIAVQAEGPLSGLFSMDKFSSLPLLLDSLREDSERSRGNNSDRSLFLVPRANVLRLETRNGQITEVLIELQELSRNVFQPGFTSRIVRLPLKQSAVVVLAGNTINSTRLALNSFPTPPALGPERMGRNLMAHVRGNFTWRMHHNALNGTTINSLATTTLHVEGRTLAAGKNGRYHFQFYAVGGMGSNAEEYLYRLIPNLEDIEDVERAIDNTDMQKWIVVGIRTCGEMFGDPLADISSRNSSFISVNPFGGAGDDVYIENGNEIRVPKAYVCLVERAADVEIRKAQTQAAAEFIKALANNNANDIQLIESKEDGLGTTYHESGTLWMGDDPSQSVTDINGHFHHINNAYCIDQSIFPTVGSANPVPTGLALSAKVARHLIARLETQLFTPSNATPLFDGTLNSWTKFGAGVIQIPPGFDILEAGQSGVLDTLGFLRHDKKFKNFELTLDWKAFDINANAGIFLRMPEIQNGNLDQLYNASIEIQIDEKGRYILPDQSVVFGSSLHKTGSVYGRCPAKAWAAKAVSPRGTEGYWNHFFIRVIDNHISVTLNNIIVIDNFILPPNLQNEGYIALQCHSDIVQFRNIHITVLP